jgi:hypothetical protein
VREGLWVVIIGSTGITRATLTIGEISEMSCDRPPQGR